jgi:hypothetical protein
MKPMAALASGSEDGNRQRGPAGPRRCIRQGLRELKWTEGVLAVYHDREALFGRAASRVRNVFRQAE